MNFYTWCSDEYVFISLSLSFSCSLLFAIYTFAFLRVCEHEQKQIHSVLPWDMLQNWLYDISIFILPIAWCRFEKFDWNVCESSFFLFAWEKIFQFSVFLPIRLHTMIKCRRKIHIKNKCSHFTIWGEKDSDVRKIWQFVMWMIRLHCLHEETNQYFTSFFVNLPMSSLVHRYIPL